MAHKQNKEILIEYGFSFLSINLLTFYPNQLFLKQLKLDMATIDDVDRNVSDGGGCASPLLGHGPALGQADMPLNGGVRGGSAPRMSILGM